MSGETDNIWLEKTRMKFFKKDKGFKILIIIYVFLLTADLISTLINGELVQYLEANPLFAFGGLPLITFLNIGVVFLLCYFYKKGSITARFNVIFVMVVSSLIRIAVIQSNLMIHANPPTIAQAMAVTEAQKTALLVKNASLTILPFFSTIFTWLFFKIDHEVNRKE